MTPSREKKTCNTDTDLPDDHRGQTHHRHEQKLQQRQERTGTRVAVWILLRAAASQHGGSDSKGGRQVGGKPPTPPAHISTVTHGRAQQRWGAPPVTRGLHTLPDYHLQRDVVEAAGGEYQQRGKEHVAVWCSLGST